MIIGTAQNQLKRHRQAFTLVELLVVISIIAMIASMALFTLYGVREDARERRARSQVMRINELLMQQWESYRTRAVPVRTVTSGMNPQAASWWRLRALRELMRMELPDRRTDLLTPASDDPSLNPAGQTVFLRSSPTLWRAYVRRARQQIIGKYKNDPTFPTFPANQDAWKDPSWWTPLHEQAECLYLILASMRDGDTTGLDSLTEDEIGDVDNDGMPEVLDPWGVPIYFLRWAPGFRSDLQLGDMKPAEDGNAGTGNGDPFDPLKVDPRWRDSNGNNDPFLLYPLVISAGRDKQFDVLLDFNVTASDPPLNYALVANDPYVFFNHPIFGVVQIGYQDDVDGDGVFGYGDNITSHFIEVK